MADRDSNFRTLVFTKTAATPKEQLTPLTNVGGDWIKITALQAGATPLSIYTRNNDGATFTLAAEVVKSLDPVVVNSRGLFPIRGTDLYVDAADGITALVEWGTNY